MMKSLPLLWAATVLGVSMLAQAESPSPLTTESTATDSTPMSVTPPPLGRRAYDDGRGVASGPYRGVNGYVGATCDPDAGSDTAILGTDGVARRQSQRLYGVRRRT